MSGILDQIIDEIKQYGLEKIEDDDSKIIMNDLENLILTLEFDGTQNFRLAICDSYKQIYKFPGYKYCKFPLNITLSDTVKILLKICHNIQINYNTLPNDEISIGQKKVILIEFKPYVYSNYVTNHRYIYISLCTSENLIPNCIEYSEYINIDMLERNILERIKFAIFYNL